MSLMTAVSFPDKASSQLTLHTDAARKLTSVECQMSISMGCKHELRWYLEKVRVEMLMNIWDKRDAMHHNFTISDAKYCFLIISATAAPNPVLLLFFQYDLSILS